MADNPATAASKLDMPLDDLVTANKPQRRRGPGGGRLPRRAPAPNEQLRRNRPMSGNRRLTQPLAADLGSKVLVSNLDFGVTESDLRVRRCIILMSPLLYCDGN
jgi:hypothetical protein